MERAPLLLHEYIILRLTTASDVQGISSTSEVIAAILQRHYGCAGPAGRVAQMRMFTEIKQKNSIALRLIHNRDINRRLSQLSGVLRIDAVQYSSTLRWSESESSNIVPWAYQLGTSAHVSCISPINTVVHYVQKTAQLPIAQLSSHHLPPPPSQSMPNPTSRARGRAEQTRQTLASLTLAGIDAETKQNVRDYDCETYSHVFPGYTICLPLLLDFVDFLMSLGDVDFLSEQARVAYIENEAAREKQRAVTDRLLKGLVRAGCFPYSFS